MGVSPTLVERMYNYVLEETESTSTPPPNPLRPKIISTTPITDRLLGLFDVCPTSLLAEGFTEGTLKEFEIGYDKWYNRVTYPIRDLMGQLVGINGRALDSDQIPRHKIYTKEYATWDLPEREWWDKRTVLYNAHRIYPSIYFGTQPTPIIVVEGYKACMWLHQAGFTNVVALLGTYLSWEHKWILERLGGPVYLFMDNNRPGWSGAYKTACTLTNSLPVYIVPYPDRLSEDESAQPDDCTVEEIFTQVSNPIYWHTFLNS